MDLLLSTIVQQKDAPAAAAQPPLDTAGAASAQAQATAGGNNNATAQAFSFEEQAIEPSFSGLGITTEALGDGLFDVVRDGAVVHRLGHHPLARLRQGHCGPEGEDRGVHHHAGREKVSAHRQPRPLLPLLHVQVCLVYGYSETI